MPRVVIETDGGERIGEVPTFETNVGTRMRPRYGHGWDGQVFEHHWSRALCREEKAAQAREHEEGMGTEGEPGVPLWALPIVFLLAIGTMLAIGVWGPG